MAATPAPRIYAICATDAPVAALLVRTKGWHLAARWDLESGKVTLGQWLRGNIYARRCDLSPNGEFLYCFAMKSGQAYHAVSRLPWLTALAFWNSLDGTWTQGFRFEPATKRGDEQVVTPKRQLASVPDSGDIEPLLKTYRLVLAQNSIPSAYSNELRRGWSEHEQCPPRASDDPWDERRKQLLCRARADGTRVVLVDHAYTKAKGEIGGRRPTYYLEAPRSKQETPLDGVRWADWDRHGRLLVATDKGSVQIRDTATGEIIAEHSFAGIVPNSQAAPPDMVHW